MAKMAKTIIFSLTLLLGAGSVNAAEPLRLAVAANFIQPMEKIAALFSSQTGIEVQASYGSSGKLYAQISQGAPYDLFLSADMERPAALAANGLCQAPFHYATGRLVLWSADPDSPGATWQEAISTGRHRIAIANPATAPYGKVALEALTDADLLNLTEGRLVYGQSVGQTFQFVQTGNTGHGFIPLSHALSSEGRRGRHWPITEATPVQQDGCRLTNSGQGRAAQLFMDFLTSVEIEAVKEAHGYQP